MRTDLAWRGGTKDGIPESGTPSLRLRANRLRMTGDLPSPMKKRRARRKICLQEVPTGHIGDILSPATVLRSRSFAQTLDPPHRRGERG